MRAFLIAAAVTALVGGGAATAQTAKPKETRQLPPKPDEPVPMAPASEELSIPTGEHWLGTVRIPVDVLANGEPLPAGSYRIRLTGRMADSAAVGQLAMLQRWVEFVQSGKVRGRAMAPVVPAASTAQVADSPPPARGRVRVQHLVQDDYLRVWFNVNGDQVLIYLPIQPSGPAVQKK